MMRPITLAAAIVCLLQCTVVAVEPFGPLSVVVPSNATASLLPPLPKEASVSVLFRDEGEAAEAVHSRAFKLRFATHFVYCSRCESPMSAIYRERLQNHGAVVIDLRALSPSELAILLNPHSPLRTARSGGLTLATSFRTTKQ